MTKFGDFEVEVVDPVDDYLATLKVWGSVGVFVLSTLLGTGASKAGLSACVTRRCRNDCASIVAPLIVSPLPSAGGHVAALFPPIF